jgi:hypothetical protein
MSESKDIDMMDICEKNQKYKIDCLNHNITFNNYYDFYNYINNNIIKDGDYYKFYIDRGIQEKVLIIMRSPDAIINYIANRFVKKLI